MSKASNFCYWKKAHTKQKWSLWSAVWPRAEGKRGTGKGAPGLEGSPGELRAPVCRPAATAPSRLEATQFESTPCDTLLCLKLQTTATPGPTFTAAGRDCQDRLCLILSLHRRLPPRMKPVFRGGILFHKKQSCGWTDLLKEIASPANSAASVRI